MDMDWNYTIEDWREALGDAEDGGFSRAKVEKDSGFAAGWLAEQYTHDAVGQNIEKLAAVIDVLEADGAETITPARFEQVMVSTRGENTSDYQTLVQAWAEEHGADEAVFALIEALVAAAEGAPDNDSPMTWRKIFDTTVRPETETYVENKDGGTFYFFDKNKW